MLTTLIRLRVLVLVLASSTVLSACSALSVINTFAGSGDYTLERDIAYGAAHRQTLDVYIPNSVKPNADVVLFFYGGGWRNGDKADHRFVGEAYASQGFVTVIPDYRLYPEASWPTFNTDGAAAYHWVETHISAKGGNPRRIFVIGHSAGAYIAAMVAMDSKLRQTAGSQIPPCGFVGLAGPYDFLPFETDVEPIFKDALNPAQTQPVFYADATDPAMLLLTGDKDKRVNPRNSVNLAKAVTAAGGNAKLIVYPDAGHPNLLISLARGLRFVTPALADSVSFIKNTDCSKR